MTDPISRRTRRTLAATATACALATSCTPTDHVWWAWLHAGATTREADHAVRIAQCESGGNPAAYSQGNYGTLQINWTAHRAWLDKLGVTEPEQLLDPATNARAGAALWQRAGRSFHPWTCA